MNLILKILLNAVAVIILAYILPGVSVSGFGTAVLVALVLGILNLLVKPLLVILTLPITILTLGLFLLVVNAIIILIAREMIGGFDVSSIWTAILFSILLSILESILHSLLDKDKN